MKYGILTSGLRINRFKGIMQKGIGRMIPAGVIEDLKYRNNIEDVIGSYVTLKRAGSNLKACCPFHSEKTPSFTVYTGEGGHFYCYGCGAGGDVVSFIMRMENLDYVPALRFLADRCGMTLPEDDIKPGGVTRARVLQMNLTAAKFFRSQLSQSGGEAGRAYLEMRRLSGTIIKRFGLGYAPDSFAALRDHLRGVGFTDEEMTEGYLCQRSRKNEKNIYDCFRGRIMFPIIDVAGNVIAFGGRVLGDGQPKYLNSADTPAFKKSKNLFALNYAKNHASDGFILCEGYMDVIALHAAGFQNAVATLGTAITPEQARLMKKYTDKVIISYDSDEAGQRAADKALRLLDAAGVDARVLNIPGAKDPDEYIKRFGAESFSKVLSGSKAPFDYKIEKTLQKFDITKPEQKVRAVRSLCEAIAAMPSRIEQDIYAERTAKTMEVDAKSIKMEIEGILRKKAAAYKKERRGQILRETSGSSDRINPDKVRELASDALERTVLGMMLAFPEYIEKVCREKLLCEDDFYSGFNKKLFAKITECHETGGFDFAMLSQFFTQDEVSRAAKYAAVRRKLSDNGNAVFMDAVSKLQKEAERIREKAACTEDDLAALIDRRRKEQ